MQHLTPRQPQDLFTFSTAIHNKILIKDVKLSARIGRVFGERITTNSVVPQGDCLSPILFTLCLADALKTERSIITEEHIYSKTPMNSKDLLQEHLKDNTHNLPRENGLLMINSIQMTQAR